MMTTKLPRAASLIAAGLLLAGCEGVFTPPPPAATWSRVELDERVTDAYTDFGFEMFRQLRADDPNGNVFISPTSAAFALAMTWNGAVGQTAEEMALALGIDHLDRQTVNETNRRWLEALRDTGDPEVELALANSIWYRPDWQVLDDFAARTREFYDAEVREMRSAEEINGWVSDNTNGLIKDIVPSPIPGNVVTYLINALYFKGDWTHPFDERQTRDAPFHRPDGSTVTVPMMTRTGKYEVLEMDGGAAVRLPYGADRFSMVLILPDHEVGLAGLAERLAAARWSEWMDGFERRERFQVGLPRFELEWESSLKATLQAMGMEVPFEAGLADFSDMFEGGGPWIGEVLQKTFLRVDEEGTEAAAATSVVMIESMPPSLVFDRPFFLAIYDHATETVLFLGQITDPS